MNKKLAWFAAVVSLASCGTTSERSTTQSLEPSRISYTRIYCTPDNESHFDTVTTDLAKVDAPPLLPLYAKGFSATRVTFAAFDAGWGAQDEGAKKYHPAPASQYVIYLSGQMSVTTSDGHSRRFRVGDVLRVEDVAPCKGHISVAGPTTVQTIVVR
jgi:quercetin dioxygenase-like cupin family protein